MISGILDSAPMLDVKRSHGTNLECAVFDIPREDVPADTFDIALTPDTEGFNGLFVMVYEMPNAANAQSAARFNAVSRASELFHTANVITQGDGNAVMTVGCTFYDIASISGTPNPPTLVDGTEAGNGVTHGSVAAVIQPIAGAVSMTFSYPGPSANVKTLLAVEVLKA